MSGSASLTPVLFKGQLYEGWNQPHISEGLSIFFSCFYIQFLSSMSRHPHLEEKLSDSPMTTSGRQWQGETQTMTRDLINRFLDTHMLISLHCRPGIKRTMETYIYLHSFQWKTNLGNDFPCIKLVTHVLQYLVFSSFFQIRRYFLASNNNHCYTKHFSFWSDFTYIILLGPHKNPVKKAGYIITLKTSIINNN